MVPSATTKEALKELMEKAENEDCYDWLDQNIGLGDEVLRFDESDLDGLPTCPTPHQYLTSFTRKKTSTGTRLDDWAPFVVINSAPVPMSYLALFLHTVGVSKSDRLAPCQPPINGKRFSEANKSSDDPYQATPVSATLLLYKLTTKPDGSRLLPMIYEDAVSRSQEPLETFATASVTEEDVMKVFQILFGSKPPDNGQNWGNLDEIGGPSTLFSLLLLCMLETYDLRTVEGCKRLITALGRHVFGAERCISMLNHLGIKHGQDHPISAIAVAFFSSVIPLKLGCLVAESFVVGNHQCLVSSKSIVSGCSRRLATTNMLLPSPTTSNSLPHCNLKNMSNKLNHTAQGCFTTGSLNDFCMEVLLEYQSKGNKMVENNEEYNKEQEVRGRAALTRIIKAARHNPHLQTIIDSYKLILTRQGKTEKEGAVPRGHLDQSPLKAEEILQKFKKISGNAHAFAFDCKGLTTILVLIMILTDFHDETNARALSWFAQTTTGVSF